jgi:hypothetical protein
MAPTPGKKTVLKAAREAGFLRFNSPQAGFIQRQAAI